MRKTLYVLSALVVFLGFTCGNSAWAQSEPGYYTITDPASGNLLSPEELDDLLAPIALYPDPLIAQILPAATFVDQIDEAARYVRQYGKNARVDDQPWDVSVKAIAHYPDLLFMMDSKIDWTVALGQAFIDQPEDVMESIQVLRTQARDRGNLYSTAQQQVITEADGDIRIVPATPQYIYLPTYDPQVIYYESQPSYGFITFGVGFGIGAWLSRDVDWRGHRVYYHGWRRGGWVGRSRPHIHDRRGIYINPRGSTIITNRKVLQRDTNRFRQELRHDVQRRRELPGRPVPPPRAGHPRPDRSNQQRPPRIEQQRPQGRPGADRGREPGQRPATTGQQPAPAAGQQRPATGERQHAPAAGQQRPAAAPQQPAAPAVQQPPAPPTPAARPGSGDVFRGRDVQRSQPASRSGYGGYGSGKDASTYRERGQSSRERMRQTPPAAQPAAPKPSAAPALRQAPAPRPAATAPAPAPRSAAPASRPAAAPAPRPHIPRPVAPAAPSAPRSAPSGVERR